MQSLCNLNKLSTQQNTHRASRIVLFCRKKAEPDQKTSSKQILYILLLSEKKSFHKNSINKSLTAKNINHFFQAIHQLHDTDAAFNNFNASDT